MTTAVDPIYSPDADASIGARPAGIFRDLSSIAGRALRAVPRDVTSVVPPVFIALFFFIVNIATLKRVTSSIPHFNYTSFEIATAVLLGSDRRVTRPGPGPRYPRTSTSTDLLLTPVRRAQYCSGTWWPT